jgi:hypothetical protein
MPLHGTGDKPLETFTQIYHAYKPGPSGTDADEYLRGEMIQLREGQTEGTGKGRLYTHNPLMPKGRGQAALDRRTEKFAIGVHLVTQAMFREYGPRLASIVLAKVKSEVAGTGRDIDKGMTRGDLTRLQEELRLQDKLQYEQLKKLVGIRRELRERVTNDTAEAIKDDLAQGWRSPSNSTETSQWPTENVGNLRSRLRFNYLQCTNMQFDEEANTLTVSQGGDVRGEGANWANLAKFIQRNLEVDLGRPEFTYVANNILSYLPQRRTDSVAQKIVNISNKAAAMDGNAVRSTFTFSMTEKRNVGVIGDTSVPFRTIGEPSGGVDFSKYSFARHEEFEIAGEHLEAVPTRFDARENLVSVTRLDTIELPNPS